MLRFFIMTSPSFLALFVATLQLNTAELTGFASDGCKEMDFKVTLEGKSLSNHVFKTERATNDAHCELKCFLADRCISYSFGTSADGKSNMCELIDSDHFMHPEDLVERPGVIYRSAQNTCTCKGKKTCRYDFIKQIGKCLCPVGFTGQNCEININDCLNVVCQHGGTCVDLVNGYTCQCAAGTSGVNCEINIDECLSNPCVNNGTCADRINDFFCTCVAGYAGKTCDTDINECASNPCRNGATCQDKLNGYDCTCTEKYYGTECTNLDNCVAYPCHHGGTCTDRSRYIGGCTCTNLYWGSRCTYFKYCENDPTLCKDGASCSNTAMNSRGYWCKCGMTRKYDYSTNTCKSWSS